VTNYFLFLIENFFVVAWHWSTINRSSCDARIWRYMWHRPTVKCWSL